MQLIEDEVHVWLADLTQYSPHLMAILSIDEQEKAARFRFDIHRQRYIVARSTLRRLLGIYLGETPSSIIIHYDEFEKPYIKHSSLQFNLSHSKDVAIYAFTQKHAIGIDIEYNTGEYTEGVAQRFFHPEENNALVHARDPAQLFYDFWAAKEAVIKAIGQGFNVPSDIFSSILTQIPQPVTVWNKTWWVYPLKVHENYASALATAIPLKTISFWELTSHDSPIRTKMESY